MKNAIKHIIKSDYSLSVFSKVLTAIIGILSSAFSTRYLGVQYKGEYAYISQVANIVVLVLNMGIYQSYSYNYKIYGKSILKKYTDICFFQFSVFIVILVAIMIINKDPVLSMIMLLVPFNVLKMQYTNIVLIENIRLSLWQNVINGLLTTLSYMALFFFAEPNPLYVVLLTITVDIITIIVFCIKMGVVPKIWNVDFSFLSSVLKFGFVPMLSGLLATINYSIDIIFLKKIGLPEELSYYSLAANIVNYVWLIPDAFKSVLFSKSAKQFDDDNIKLSSQLSTAFIVLCFAGFTLLGKPILCTVYGEEFVHSYGVTLLLIVGAFSMSLYKIIGVVLVSQGKRIAHFASLAISATINVILNAILIPQLGMYGAGIASVCSYTVCGLGLMLYFCKLYPITPTQLVVPSAQIVYKFRNILKK